MQENFNREVEMIKLLKNENGTIISFVAAISVALVSVISAVSLTDLVATDQLKTQYQQDMIQEEILLRSENRRTHLSIEYNQNRPLPPRTVEINEPHRNTTYNINSRSRVKMISNFMGYATEQVVEVTSSITAKRARPFQNANFSPIQRSTTRYMRNESLAQYQYFTDKETSENADGGHDASLVKFWGPDVFHGKVHSNDDIWIQEAGGGSNNNWPTFYDMVTTAGIFRKYPSGQRLEDSGAPMDQIFRHEPAPGWQENVSSIIFSPDASELQQNGERIFDGQDCDIAYVKLSGSGFDSHVGRIELDGYENFTVYSWYPQNASWVNAVINAGGNWFEDSDSLWVNQVAIYDTIWSQGPSGTVNNRSVYVNGAELWIEGTVRGRQTWGCSEDVYITDDIEYYGTTPGTPPDDEDNPNRSDYFGLVSEGKLFIKYKHIDPENGTLRDGNCNDINMYGAYAAIGEGDVGLYGEMSCHYDGIFTFEYQHPHGSTPNFVAASPYTLQETTYTYIDLHKYIFPINHFVPPNIDGFNLHGAPPPDGLPCGYNYNYLNYFNSYPNSANGSPTYNYVEPYGTDYPWYNPVWPEDRQDIVFERGTIHLYGAIAQRRRGFVHRSGSDPYNHPNNEWNLDEFHYNGIHPSTGYYKDYHYDQRFLFVQPPDYPQVYNGQWGDEEALTAFDEQTWFFITPDE
jgi:hypothetical protein